MNAKSATGPLVLAIVLMAVAGPSSSAQQPATEPKDEVLDSLLQKLSEPSNGAGAKKADSLKDVKAEKSAKSKGADSQAKAKAQPAEAKPGTGPAKGDKPAASKPGGGAAVSGKDQELDDLLQKLGETKDTPSPDERPRGGPGSGEDKKGQSPSQPGKADRDKLTGKDKETDEHLEELTGRRRKKKQDDGQRTGQVGEMIKEMRDVEEKLGKPDTGEGTRQQQKKIVKHIDTMIEEAKKSGSAMGRMRVRMVRRPGQQQGQQEGQPGAMARGASATKPLQPTGKHSTAGGKDIWGHLPPELRQEIENQIHEEALEIKRELIDRYYISINKGKLVREE